MIGSAKAQQCTLSVGWFFCGVFYKPLRGSFSKKEHKSHRFRLRQLLYVIQQQFSLRGCFISRYAALFKKGAQKSSDPLKATAVR